MAHQLSSGSEQGQRPPAQQPRQGGATLPAERWIEGDDIMRLIFALEAIMPAHASWADLPQEERERWGPFGALRDKLADIVGLYYHETARTWRQQQCELEREATVEEIHRRLNVLLQEPEMTRHVFRERMIKLLRDVKEHEQYKRPPLGGWPFPQPRRD